MLVAMLFPVATRVGVATQSIDERTDRIVIRQLMPPVWPLFLGNVDLSAGAFELGGERLGVGQLTAVQDEVGTELGEALTDVSADPAARAGDE